MSLISRCVSWLATTTLGHSASCRVPRYKFIEASHDANSLAGSEKRASQQEPVSTPSEKRARLDPPSPQPKENVAPNDVQRVAQLHRSNEVRFQPHGPSAWISLIWDGGRKTILMSRNESPAGCCGAHGRSDLRKYSEATELVCCRSYGSSWVMLERKGTLCRASWMPQQSC